MSVPFKMIRPRSYYPLDSDPPALTLIEAGQTVEGEEADQVPPSTLKVWVEEGAASLIEPKPVENKPVENKPAAAPAPAAGKISRAS